MTQHIEVLPDKTALVQRSTALIVEKIQTAIAQRGTCTIALSGGSTPKPIYEAIARHDLPWDQLHIFWGDERYVPPDHPDSNQRMAREAWLDQVALPPGNIHPMPTGSQDPETDADCYDQQLKTFFNLESDVFPCFDIMLLGMGDDGHTASLFPHTEALEICDRRVTVGNKDGDPRITLTVPVINLSRTIVFAIAGENKQGALAQVFASEGDEYTYPSRLIQPVDGEIWWLLDGEAGAQVTATVS
ncbi:6-phosphogluconolactonase [Phormidium yuhuli AB48]|uniref:6-phosphogluconolactonase n=1 Tax=Phormidium yuhuli AB48 TaxID=2940671 RepID=A0ABY5AQ97_9CYAN|nr:6-phosphogluconolactonase [Phormidium yuhuli]USR91399.1 6-phosphogluconolactonase [Phormidium yuhuli AB48]